MGLVPFPRFWGIINNLFLMIEKVTALVGSVRFWIVTLTSIVAVLQGLPFLDVLQVWAASVVGIGTLDSVAKKIGGK